MVDAGLEGKLRGKLKGMMLRGVARDDGRWDVWAIERTGAGIGERRNLSTHQRCTSSPSTLSAAAPPAGQPPGERL
jgi:hypothetical protein